MRMGQRKMISVLEDAVRYVERSDADFSWSSWKDSEHAVLELNNLLSRVKKGDRSALREISVLFLPTGPLQELSLSSGWGREFLRLAGCFDRASLLWKLRIPFF